MNDKKPRLFYWEEAVEAWCPVPEGFDPCVIGISLEDLDDKETQEVQFRRYDMTDKELLNLPGV